MTELLPLDLPAITMDGTKAGCDLNRKAYDLHADHLHGGVLPLGYAMPPDEFLIEGVMKSWQGMGATPAGLEGRITLFVDPGEMYCKEVGFTTGVEDGHPRGLQPISCIEFIPGSRPPFLPAIAPPLIGPFMYRKGSRLCVGPETNNAYIGANALQGFFKILFAWPGLRLDTNVIHAMPLNNTIAGGAKASFRSIVKVPKGGNRAKFHFAAGADGMAVAHAGIGVRTGSVANMAAAPVQAAFGGAAGFTLPAAGDLWSDDVVIDTADGCDLVIDLSITGGWAFKGQAGPTSGVNSYWTDVASWNAAVQAGTPTKQPGRLHCIDCIKVWTA